MSISKISFIDALNTAKTQGRLAIYDVTMKGKRIISITGPEDLVSSLVPANTSEGVTISAEAGELDIVGPAEEVAKLQVAQQGAIGQARLNL